MDRVGCFKYFGIHITEGLIRVLQTDLWWQRQGRDCFTSDAWGYYGYRIKYWGMLTIESILKGNITVQYSEQPAQRTARPDCKTMQRVVISADRRVSSALFCRKDIYTRLSMNKALIFLLISKEKQQTDFLSAAYERKKKPDTQVHHWEAPWEFKSLAPPSQKSLGPWVWQQISVPIARQGSSLQEVFVCVCVCRGKVFKVVWMKMHIQTYMQSIFYQG